MLSLSRLLSLAQSNRAKDGLIAAKDAGIPSDVLEQLSSDSSVLVRRAVAENRSLGFNPSIVEKMKNDEDHLVRQILECRDYRIGIAKLEHLSRSKYTRIRLLVCCNQKLNLPSLLAAQDDKALRSRIVRRLRGDRDATVRSMAIAIDPAASPKEILSVSKSKSVLVRIFLATREDLPEQVTDALRSDLNWEVREKIACNKSVSPRVLSKLVSDRELSVVVCLRNNPRLPTKLKRAIEKRIEDLGGIGAPTEASG